MRISPPVEDGNENTKPRTTRRSPDWVRSAAETRLRAWVEGLLASGLCRRLPDGRAALVCSQAELARRLGLSPSSGSISKRLTTLERMGVLVCRDPVVFDLGTEARTDTSVESRAREAVSAAVTDATFTFTEQAPATATSTPADEPDRLAIVVGLLHQVCVLERADLLDRILEVVASPLLVSGPPPERPPRAAPAPQLPSTSVQDTSSLLPVSLLPHSLPDPRQTPLPDPRQGPSHPSALVLPDGTTAGSTTSARRPDRYRFRRVPDAAARLQALAPLLEDCARRGLPGVGSPSGLLEALDGYTLEQIAVGVEFVRSQLAASSPLRSPVGLLAHMARTGDLALVEHVPTPSRGVPPRIDPRTGRDATSHERLPSQEPPGEWLARMGALMRIDEPGHH